MKAFRSSLIIPTYNWPEALALCLASVGRQTQMPDEVLIADDGSTEETAAVIEHFRSTSSIPLHHIWQPDDGFQKSMAMNKAIAAASGDYCIQIDGDQILHPACVADHISAARIGYYTGGSRVLLDAERTALLWTHAPTISLFDKGIRNHLNGCYIPWLRKLLSTIRDEKRIDNLRGSNMAFWRSDFIAVNGYNEEISGWGREDTELVLRLVNLGLKRNFFKFGGIVYHLFHREFDRSRLEANDAVMQATITHQWTRCKKGIDQYL
jgi:glycosyltransferase involved in cell wall biosynthesis